MQKTHTNYTKNKIALSGVTAVVALAAVLILPAAVQAQMFSPTTSSTNSNPNPVTVMNVASPCPTFTRSLSIGTSGADVTVLQEYLAGQGYFNTRATGYFGPITWAAVAKWQAQGGVVTAGAYGSGTFGPLSRAYFSRVCGMGSGNVGNSGSGSSGGNGVNGNGGTISTGPQSQNVGFAASPQMGLAPLTVRFIATAPQGGNFGTSVDFGDGSTSRLLVIPVCSSCNLEATVSHTYTSASTYTASLTGGNCSCPAGGICNCPNMAILATTSVVVTGTESGTGSGGGSSGIGTGGTSSSTIMQINAPGSVTLVPGGIAEIRNESAYFTLASMTTSTATIAISPVGCWNSFPSDPPPTIVCMLAMVPIPPQTLSVGQSYSAANYSVTLTQIVGGGAVFEVEQ